MSETAAALMGPEVIPQERYAVTSVLRQTSNTFLARAIERHSGEKVLLKAKGDLSDEAMANPARRIIREAEILAELDHPQIPKLYDKNLETDTPYIVTKLLPANLFYENWFKICPAPELAAWVCLSALQPLAYIHKKGIVHRDVKTTNFVAGLDGRMSLIDFELALDYGEDDPHVGTDEPRVPLTTRVTSEGKVVGTAEYLSPERVLGERGDARCDVYAMGIMMYALLYGRLPIQNESTTEQNVPTLDMDKAHEIRIRQLHEPIDVEGTRGWRVPEWLKAIVLIATQKDPELRYVDADEMSKDVARFLRASPGDVA